MTAKAWGSHDVEAGIAVVRAAVLDPYDGRFGNPAADNTRLAGGMELEVNCGIDPLGCHGGQTELKCVGEAKPHGRRYAPTIQGDLVGETVVDRLLVLVVPHPPKDVALGFRLAGKGVNALHQGIIGRGDIPDREPDPPQQPKADAPSIGGIFPMPLCILNDAQSYLILLLPCEFCCSMPSGCEEFPLFKGKFPQVFLGADEQIDPEIKLGIKLELFEVEIPPFVMIQALKQELTGVSLSHGRSRRKNVAGRCIDIRFWRHGRC